ncbi:uncharacterized protein [Lolium perenne]|uniref:uncharacterized protein isoform X1 n=1 Tax=Lolium perenne TaxID=4522 RepID=UPI0021F68F5A|nr:protein MEI2-like 7 isoform X1 [Lolium perenne]
MAMAYLNAGARPYHRRPSYRPHPSPLRPPPPPPAVPAYYYGNAGCPPPLHLAPSYSRATFPEHHHPLNLPPPPQQQFFRNHAPSPPRHGPHGLAFPNNRGGLVCEKLYAQAMYRYNNKAGAARREVACGPRAWTRGRGGSAHARGAGRAARSPSPAFTTRPGTWIPPPPWFGRTTVMIRNIPAKLTRAAVMALLDDHCARENRRRRGRAAAYDFLYLPMDFSSEPSSNRGYAFVNFTTADAARGFHYALHGCGWKPWVAGRSHKSVNIAAAHIQGKRAIVRRFNRSKFVCETDEFLPAVFRPPRNGANNAQPRNLGRRLPPLVSSVQPPPPVEPAQQQQQQLAWMPVRVQAS